jgi:hypothetical protein
MHGPILSWIRTWTRGSILHRSPGTRTGASPDRDCVVVYDDTNGEGIYVMALFP